MNIFKVLTGIVRLLCRSLVFITHQSACMENVYLVVHICFFKVVSVNKSELGKVEICIFLSFSK